MRLEILLYCALLGMLALDISANLPVLLAKDAALEQAVANARTYFVHNMSAVGVVTLVVPIIVGGIGAMMVLRLVRERKLLDMIAAVMGGWGCWLLFTSLEPLERGLQYIPGDRVSDLKDNLVEIFFMHVFLTVLLLTGIVLQLFAQPPTGYSRVELLPAWVALGMNTLDLTFDMPVMLNPDADRAASFIQNTIHQDTFIHLQLIPAIIASFFLFTLVRILRHRNVKDITILLLCIVSGLLLFGFVEPEERAMLQAGTPNIKALQLVGASHAAFVVLILVGTALSLSSERDQERAHQSRKMKQH